MTKDRFLKRLRKKARKGLRGWPIATIAFYGPNRSQATKVVVGIMPSENAEVKELRDWKADRGDVRAEPRNRPRDTGIYGESSSAIGRDDRCDCWHAQKVAWRRVCAATNLDYEVHTFAACFKQDRSFRG